LALLCIRAHIGYEFGWTYLFLDKDSMTDQRKAAKWQGIAPRVVTDFLIIHCAMLVAFAISVS
jgi:hypothetical protein